MSKPLAILTTLKTLAKKLTLTFSSMESNYVTACSQLGEARDLFTDDDEFWSWVAKETPFKKNTAYLYLQIEHNVLRAFDHDQKDAIKAMSFRSLREIAKTKIPKAAKIKVVNEYQKHLKDPAKHAKPTSADVKRIVKDALPPKASKTKVVKSRKPFADRLAEHIAGKAANPFYLFALAPDAHHTDAAVFLKVWQHKYHPDKGGSAEEFNLINTLGKDLINTLKGQS